MQLQAADDVVHVLEEGVLDHRAVAAFVGGQCHGLALALHEQEGWQLIAVDNTEGGCDHVCVRRPDGQLVDVTGPHTIEEMEAAAGAPVREIERSDIAGWEREHGWAPADVDGAKAWIPEVLARVEPLPALRGCTLHKTVAAGGLELSFSWPGHIYIEVSARRGTDQPWTHYTDFVCPRDDRGRRVVEFASDQFEKLVHLWMTQRFDPEKAAASL